MHSPSRQVKSSPVESRFSPPQKPGHRRGRRHVAYVSAEVFARARDSAFFEGPPVLAVEVLSPSDQQGDIDDKVQLYLESGVAVVWVINPIFRTVTVFRPDAEPEMFNVLQELAAEPHLPGFRVSVARLFPD